MAKFGEWVEVIVRPLTDEEKEEYNQEYEEHWYEEPSFIYDCELPDDNQEVLITTKYGVEKTTFCNDDCAYFEQFEDEDDVLAWMPLPKPFIKGNKN